MIRFVALSVGLGLGLSACSSSDDTPSETGGYPGYGGTPATGGAKASGGVTSTGGVTTTGGVTSTGGIAGTGGASSGGASSGGTSGGGSSSGGSNSGGTSSGGSSSGGSSSGGSSTGGAATGGSSATGGSGNTGGQTEKLLGWASVSGDGDSTTTGGGNATPVEAKSATQLEDLASQDGPAVITFKGTMKIPRLDVASNKTIRGLDATATIEGGVRIRGDKDAFVHNVILQNVKVNGATSDVEGDAVQIHYAHHVWVDHADIWDGADGNLDIVHGSNWVTVSWTKLHYTSAAPAPDHKFSDLIGHSDSNSSEDTGRLKVSFHHVWWADGAKERMPRVRFGQVHVWNSYYSAAGNNYCVGAALQSHVLVENNFFENVANPHFYYDDEPTAGLLARGNEYKNTTGKQDSGRGTVTNPTYSYTPDAATAVPDIVKNGAGPH